MSRNGNPSVKSRIFKKSKFLLLVFIVLLVGIIAESFADTLILKNGGKVEGKVIKREGGRVLLEVVGGTVTFEEQEILRIKYGQDADKDIQAAKAAKKKRKISRFWKLPKLGQFFKGNANIFFIVLVAVMAAVLLFWFVAFFLKNTPASKKSYTGDSGRGARPLSYTMPSAASQESASLKEEASESFLKMLLSAFVYPLKGGGKILLLIGIIFFGFLKLLSFMPVGGWFFGVLGGGYLTAYMFKIIKASAMGKNELPDWPDFTDFAGDIVRPLVRVAVTFLVSFGPAILCLILGFVKGPVFFIPAAVLGGLGMLYYPMALMATALEIDMHFHPLLLFSSILRIFLPYMAACIMLGVIVAVNVVFGKLLSNSIPLLGFILKGLFSFYIAIVEMRILGLVYYNYSGLLGWDDF